MIYGIVLIINKRAIQIKDMDIQFNYHKKESNKIIQQKYNLKQFTVHNFMPQNVLMIPFKIKLVDANY